VRIFLSICILAGLAACGGAGAITEAAPVNPTPSAKPLNIAHRGARSLAPENTMAAARLALAIGADLWELDVAVTADGELVVLHDDTLERTSNAAEVYPERAPWAAHTFTLEELRALDFGSWFNQSDPFQQIASGAVTEAMQASYIGEPLPTLREALVFTRDNQWRVNVEIKDASGTPGDADVAEKVAALIEELDMVEVTLISSFNHEYLRRVKAASPGIVTAALVSQPAGDPVALVQGLQAAAYNPGLRAIRPEQIPAVRAAGVDVYVWTVNDVATMRALIDNQVSGIFTDFPQLLKELLAE
jgi:glycerophosphoryl diester phosphodiesterase